jgi:hypothetical protein
MKCKIETGNADLRDWAEFTEEELSKMTEWDRLRPRGSAEHDILKWGQGRRKSESVVPHAKSESLLLPVLQP